MNVAPLTTRQGVIQSTGEVVAVDFPASRGRRREGRRRVFALVDLDVLSNLELTSVEWRVLHRVMRAVNPESNEARVLIREIAADLGMAPQNISRVLIALRDRRLVQTVRLGHHRVNAHLMYRGSNQDWDVATLLEPEPIWRRS